jgi:glycosyltransferase involved in cell wall biosynthesis
MPFANKSTDSCKVHGEGMRNPSSSASQTEVCEKGNELKISVIIPTKNRAADLKATLDDLVAQTRRPDEIVIVDQSTLPSFDPAGFPIAVNYLHAPRLSGAAVARNVAMDQATGDIWVFLDDDVILEPEYIEEIVISYNPGVAGVSGIITNYSVPPLVRRMFEKTFVKGAFHDDRQPIYWRADALKFHAPQRVRQFGCGVMSFRANVIREIRFDPMLTGGSLAEDIDFCARLPRGSVLLIAPKARLFHKRSAVGRVTDHWLDQHAQSSAYMRLRNWNRGFQDDLSFAWLQVGYMFMATIGSLKRGSLEPFRAWKNGRARGRSLASQNLKSSPFPCGKETLA